MLSPFLKDAYIARGWVVAVLVGALYLGIVAFIFRCKRNRRGYGMSQLPPLIFIGAWVPAVISEPTLIFNQTGFTVLRVLEVLISGAALIGAAFLIEGDIPTRLADRFCCRENRDMTDGDQ